MHFIKTLSDSCDSTILVYYTVIPEVFYPGLVSPQIDNLSI